MNYKQKLVEIYNEAIDAKDYSHELTQQAKNNIEVLANNCFTQKGVYTAFVTLAIYKIVHKNQDIRKHQTQLEGGFSGRTIDTAHITPTLKALGLPSMAVSAWLTRSLEQPHPYTLDYEGKISNKTVKKAFLELVDDIQNSDINPKYILVELLKQIIDIQKKNKIIINPLANPDTIAIKSSKNLKKPTFLDAIKIQNYFSIKNIEIANLKDKKEIYFVGENGDGKTILLQAIVLALKKDYSGVVIEHIQNIKASMRVLAKDESSIEYSDMLNLHNLFAYGINRNKVHYNDFDKYGYGGLFDTSDSRKTTYLKDPFIELGKKYKKNNLLLKEFIEKLNGVILPENYHIFDGGKIDFIELSAGYKSTIIWLYDLVSRLIENQKEAQQLAELKAIVLIDEVDLYLHPKWKYDFVHHLRVVFPSIQFIMITHSIETILGASEDAVFYKVYKEEGETKISKPIESIKNLMANNLSTSPLFDMSTARARNSDENIDTSDDFLYTKIHQAIAKRIEGKEAIVEEDIATMIEQELDEFLKENS